MKVAPSILSADFARLGEEVVRVERAGADWVHIDVMDGVFVPNITIGPDVIGALRPLTSIPFDVHLMIVKPERYVERFVRSGADFVTLHQEAGGDLRAGFDILTEADKGRGLSLNPETGFDKARPYLEELDILLIMAVNPGFGGQSFMRCVLPKIVEARKMRDDHGYRYEIAIDGGINRNTGLECAKAGATVLAAGNSLFKAENMEKEIEIWHRY